MRAISRSREADWFPPSVAWPVASLRTASTDPRKGVPRVVILWMRWLDGWWWR